MIRGYARVSTQDQDLGAQLDALRSAKAEKLYHEKVSGASRSRQMLDSLLAEMQPGDGLLVTRLDRLARSTYDLLGILRTCKERGVTFKSLAEPWCDTSTPSGELLITLLGAVATFERQIIIARTSEGRARARAKGQSIGGAKPKLTPHQEREALERCAQGEEDRDVAKSYNVHRSTIWRLRNRSISEHDTLR